MTKTENGPDTGGRTRQDYDRQMNDNRRNSGDGGRGEDGRQKDDKRSTRHSDDGSMVVLAAGGEPEEGDGGTQTGFRDFPGNKCPQWATWNLGKLGSFLDNPVRHSDLFAYWERTYDRPCQPPTNESEFEAEAEPIRAAMLKKEHWDGSTLVELLGSAFKQSHVLRSTPEFVKIRAAAMNIAQANPMEIYANEQVFVDDRLTIDEDTIVWMAAQEVLGSPWTIYNVDTDMRDDLNEATKRHEDKLATRARAKARREGVKASKKEDAISTKRPRNPLDDTSTRPDDDPPRGKDNSMDVDCPAAMAASPGSSMTGTTAPATESTAHPKKLTFTEMTKQPAPTKTKEEQLTSLRQFRVTGARNPHNTFFTVKIKWEAGDDDDEEGKDDMGKKKKKPRRKKKKQAKDHFAPYFYEVIEHFLDVDQNMTLLPFENEFVHRTKLWKFGTKKQPMEIPDQYVQQRRYMDTTMEWRLKGEEGNYETRIRIGHDISREEIIRDVGFYLRGEGHFLMVSPVQDANQVSLGFGAYIPRDTDPAWIEDQVMERLQFKYPIGVRWDFVDDGRKQQGRQVTNRERAVMAWFFLSRKQDARKLSQALLTWLSTKTSRQEFPLYSQIRFGIDIKALKQGMLRFPDGPHLRNKAIEMRSKHKRHTAETVEIKLQEMILNLHKKVDTRRGKMSLLHFLYSITVDVVIDNDGPPPDLPGDEEEDQQEQDEQGEQRPDHAPKTARHPLFISIFPQKDKVSHIIVASERLEKQASNIALGLVAYVEHFLGVTAVKHWFTGIAKEDSTMNGEYWCQNRRMVMSKFHEAAEGNAEEIAWWQKDELANIDDAPPRQEPPDPTIQFDETAITDLHDCGDTVATEATRREEPRPPGEVVVGTDSVDTSTIGDTDSMSTEAINQLIAKLNE